MVLCNGAEPRGYRFSVSLMQGHVLTVVYAFNRNSDIVAFPDLRNVSMPLNRTLEEAFDIFGQDMKKAVLDQLKHSAGINLDEPLLSISKLSDAIAALCGPIAAELIMERVVVGLECNVSEYSA